MFNTLTIQTRLLILGIAATLGIALSGGFGLMKLSQMSQYFDKNLAEVERGVGALINVSVAQTAFKTQVQEFKNVLLRGQDAEQLDKYTKAFEKEGTKVQGELKAAAGIYRTESNSPHVKEIEELVAIHREMSDFYLSVIKSFDPADSESYKKLDAMVKGKDRPVQAALGKLVADIEREEQSHLKEQAVFAAKLYTDTRNVSAAAILVVIVALAAFIMLMKQQIAGQVKGLQSTMANVSRDLNLMLRAPAEDDTELSLTGRSLNQLLDEFQKVIGSMKGDSTRLNSTSSELADAVSQLSSSVNMQVDSTSSMAAAMEEMAVSIAHVAQASKTSSEISKTSMDLASEGAAAIANTVSSMDQVTVSVGTTTDTVTALGVRSKEIESISGVIKDIADQTNLLALNAAIEAARAGETGRGFAVVADEVRKLAERTANATTEIGVVIQAIQHDTQKAVVDMQQMVTQVANTAGAARAAGEVMARIRDGATRVLDTSGEISSALHEQSITSDSVARDVERIVGMSEENNRALESVRAAAQGMSGLSADMDQMASRFKA